MKRGRRKDSPKRNVNQLSLDFTQNVPIEIHIPRHSNVNIKKEIAWNKKTIIELVRN